MRRPLTMWLGILAILSMSEAMAQGAAPAPKPTPGASADGGAAKTAPPTLPAAKTPTGDAGAAAAGSAKPPQGSAASTATGVDRAAAAGAPKGNSASSKSVTAELAKLGADTLREAGHAATTLVFDALRQELPRLQAEMRERSLESRTKGRKNIAWILMLLPGLAIIVVPIWLWRAGYLRRGKENNRSTGKLFFYAAVATIFIVALLEIFVQLFLLLETAKSRLAIASPAQLLAVKALDHALEEGKLLSQEALRKEQAAQGGKGGPVAKKVSSRPVIRALTPAVHAVVTGKARPETFIQGVIRYASEVYDSGALQIGHVIFRYGRPVLDHLWSILLGIALILFIRFSGPGIVEIAEQVSGEAKKGTLFGAVLRNAIREGVIVGVFIIPYAIITTAVTFLAYWVTDFGAAGIIQSLFASIDRLIADDVSTVLIVANFAGLFLFMLELMLLLVAVSAVLLGSWMAYLHDKARKEWLKRIGKFLMHFLMTTLRLLPVLAIVSALLFFALGFVEDNRATLGPTVEMLVPVFLFVALNVLLWLGRFFKSLRRGLSTEAWRPTKAAEAEAPAHVELP